MAPRSPSAVEQRIAGRSQPGLTGALTLRGISQVTASHACGPVSHAAMLTTLSTPRNRDRCVVHTLVSPRVHPALVTPNLWMP